MTVHFCDTNVWLSLALSRHVHHAAARDWLGQVDAPASILFCRVTQQSFLRLLTNAAVLAPYGNAPLTNREAWAAYESLAADDRIALQVEEPAETERLWIDFASRPTASPKLWMDAYLAAFAAAGGFQVVTTDTAFRQFTGVETLILGEGSRAAP